MLSQEEFVQAWTHDAALCTAALGVEPAAQKETAAAALWTLSANADYQLERNATEKLLSPNVLAKLKQPSLKLEPDQSIEVLVSCVEYGARQAKVATGKDLVITIGNTGAGKR